MAWFELSWLVSNVHMWKHHNLLGQHIGDYEINKHFISSQITCVENKNNNDERKHLPS
jgi:hypothetical protein